MSGYPIVLDGSVVEALVVGGGPVASRKAQALLDAGARVRVVALVAGGTMHAMARAAGARLTLVERAYTRADMGDAQLVIAAAEPSVNARVARDAKQAGRLVNVANAPGEGSFVTPALHRAGPLLIAVVAGGVPQVAARVRDAIALRFDARYAAAIGQLGALRRRLLAAGDRDAWRTASAELVGDEFCEAVERGDLAERAASWR